MPQLSSEMQWLVEAQSKDYSRPAPKDSEKIKLSQLVSKLGFFYEKIRNAVDYNDEHLIRRNSLKRFLRRQIFFIQEKDAFKISQALIFEFIRATYLPNDSLPETVIEEIAKPIEKYLAIFNFININAYTQKNKLSEWAIDLAACEIDEKLFPIDKELAMINFMYSQMVSSISFIQTNIDEKERNLQIYLAVLKTIGKADKNILYYRLLKLYIPDWNDLSPDAIMDFCQNLTSIKGKMDAHLSHPITFQLFQMIKRQSVFFIILKEIIEKNQDSAESLNDEVGLTQQVQETCQSNYQRIRSRLIGSIIRVIIYILLTKTVLAFILEVPYDLFVVKSINFKALAINVIFHPTLMFIIAMTIKVPGPKNTQIIIDQIKKIVYGEERKIVFKQKKLMNKGSVTYFVFNVIYLIMFMVSFGIIVYALILLDFNLLSSLLFIFFLTLVSFLGFRLRNLANQFLVIPRKDNLRNFLIDFLTLPIVRVGRVLSANFSKINIFIYILDFIIETPFKMLVEFLEKATSFIREKRDEISD
ncbi:MAG: hypothetical protein WC244_03320 [Patescibacteria group bacterium]|jgi:hypothetical protein